MRIDLVTLFPQVIAEFAALGVTGEALRAGKAQLAAWNPRDFSPEGRPDDRPFGGGAGMVMQPAPLAGAIKAARTAGVQDRPVLLLSPQGEPLDQAWAARLARGPGMIVVAGRYEGVDERLIEECVDAQVSIGDLVVSGGELPALLLIDAVLRLLPEVLGDARSAVDESFVDGRLEYPQYTRPQSWRGRKVPAVLLSGDHQKIRRWRAVQALGRSFVNRPDLLESCALDADETAQLHAYVKEYLAGLDNDATPD